VSVDCEISSRQDRFAREVNTFCEQYDFCSDTRHAVKLAAEAEMQKLTCEANQLEAG